MVSEDTDLPDPPSLIPNPSHSWKQQVTSHKTSESKREEVLQEQCVQGGDDSHLPHVPTGAGHVWGGQPSDINRFHRPCWLCSLFPQLGAGAGQQLPPGTPHWPTPLIHQPLPWSLCHHKRAAPWHQHRSSKGNSSKFSIPNVQQGDSKTQL